MNLKICLPLCCAVYAGVFSLCGKGTQVETRYGPDSLSRATVQSLMPSGSSADDLVKVRQILFRHALAKTLGAGVTEGDSVAIKCAKRLSLQSGAEWSPEAAAVLLISVKALVQKISETQNPEKVAVFIDSLSRSLGMGGPDHSREASAVLSGASLKDLGDVRVFANVVSGIFGVSIEEALTLASFTHNVPEKKPSGKPPDVNDMVRGIFAKGRTGPAAASAPDLEKDSIRALCEKQKSLRALQALRHRTQESIRDSIARHLPNLEQIYKKQLKINELSSGKVWIVFTVDAGGTVLSAVVKSSEIENLVFQQILAEYVSRIHFKPIPPDLERMVFEFPFEFKAEG